MLTGPKFRTTPIPDVPPQGYTSVAATADPLRRAPRTPDGRPVPAGLLARGSDASSSLPGPRIWPVALVNEARRLQLRGQPRLGGSRSPLPCSLFTRPHNGQEPARQPNNQRCPRPSSAGTPALSMLTALLRVRCRQATNRSPPAPLGFPNFQTLRAADSRRRPRRARRHSRR